MTGALGAPEEEDDFSGVEVPGLSSDGASYRFERVLGSGSQAVAWLAVRRVPAGVQRVVLKVWRGSFVKAHPEVARLVLRKESVALARLAEQVPSVPFVVRFIDAGEVPRASGGALPWLALEHVAGGPFGTTLRARIDGAVSATGTGLGPRRTARLFRGLLEGAATLHRTGVVHRDLKPTNVLVCGDGDDELPKIGDLGVARAVGMKTTFGAHVTVGSVGYAAPEQGRDDRVGTWSDVFSLAALLSFALTGAPPVDGSVMVALARLQSRQLAPLAGPRVHPAWSHSGVLPALADVRARAMVVGPRERTPTVEHLGAELWPLFEQAIRVEREVQSDLGPPLPALGAAHGSHEPRADARLRAAALAPDGSALAASARGLLWWDGTQWAPVTRGLANESGRRFGGLARIGPRRWVAALDGGEIALLGAAGVVTSQAVGERHWTARAVAARDPRGAGEPKVLSILAGFEGGGFSWLLSFADGRWSAPVRLGEGEEVQSVAVTRQGVFAALVGPVAGVASLLVWTVGGTPRRSVASEAQGLSSLALDGEGRLWRAEAGLRWLGDGALRAGGGPVLRGRLLAVRADGAGGMAVDAGGRIVAW